MGKVIYLKDRLAVDEPVEKDWELKALKILSNVSAFLALLAFIPFSYFFLKECGTKIMEIITTL